MTEYWKSNERKYCDFCKCWIGDNKASVSFHENGKRHKANVAKRITEISRSSEKDEREKKKMDAEIRKMEDAAMRSYAQDIHSHGDFTARTIRAVIGASTSDAAASSSSGALSSLRQRQVDPMRLPGSDDEDESQRVSVRKVDEETVPEASLWVEGKSDDGHTYYWNVKTNESVWAVPKEGFMSWAEYQRINDLALKQQELKDAVEAKHFRENVNEEVARFNRERLKAFRRPESAQEKKVRVERQEAYKTEEEAAAQEIGVWQTVEYKPPPAPIDWELPQTQNSYVAPIIIEAPSEPPVKRFKEKTIESLDPELACNTTPAFKKRKFASKGNTRQRSDND